MYHCKIHINHYSTTIKYFFLMRYIPVQVKKLQDTPNPFMHYLDLKLFELKFLV